MRRILLIAIVILVVAAAGAAVWLLVGAEKPYKGYEGNEQFVEIPPGAGPALIGRRLTESGVVRDSRQLSRGAGAERPGAAPAGR